MVFQTFLEQLVHSSTLHLQVMCLEMRIWLCLEKEQDAVSSDGCIQPVILPVIKACTLLITRKLYLLGNQVQPQPRNWQRAIRFCMHQLSHVYPGHFSLQLVTSCAREGCHQTVLRFLRYIIQGAFFIIGLGHEPEILLAISLLIQTESSDFPGFFSPRRHTALARFRWTPVVPSATRLPGFVQFCFFLLPPACSTTALFQCLTRNTLQGIRLSWHGFGQLAGQKQTLELWELKYTLLSEILRAGSSCRLTESQKYLDDTVNFLYS